MNQSGFVPIGSSAKVKTFPGITILLIVINIVVFFLLPDDTAIYFAFIPEYPTLVTLFTHIFLHADIFHLFGNMLFLWIFGKAVESALGGRNFLIIYFSAGLAAVLAHSLLTTVPSIPIVGASGAISGILGAYLLLYPKSKVRVYLGFFISTDMPAIFYAFVWFAIQIYFGLISLHQDLGVAFFAHIGGFIAGMIMLPMLLPRKQTQRI
ncbi:MAG: rhomboid family intramembrane serine protease [Candidatus Diapherotrites archaeon]|nr:rhomboid family intramembrane serine protease [Candidatus Diapherotrites archaeon]